MKRIAGLCLSLVVVVPACVSSTPETKLGMAPTAGSPAPTAWKWQAQDPAFAFVDPDAQRRLSVPPTPPPVEQFVPRDRGLAMLTEDAPRPRPAPGAPLSPDLMVSTATDQAVRTDQTDRTDKPAPAAKSERDGPVAFYFQDIPPRPSRRSQPEQVQAVNYTPEEKSAPTAPRADARINSDPVALPPLSAPPTAPSSSVPTASAAGPAVAAATPAPLAALPPAPASSAPPPPAPASPAPAPPGDGAIKYARNGPPIIRVVNSRRITLNFEVKDVGPSGVAGIDVWSTRDWKEWQRHEAPPQGNAFVVEVAEEGLYGFTLQAHSGAGAAKGPPAPGDMPQVLVMVDLTKPVVQLVEASLAPIGKPRTLTIRWKAGDPNLGRQPISLSYAPKEGGPWQPIACNLENSGCFVWDVPPTAPTEVFVRVEAVDLAGNVGQAQLSKPLVLDTARPFVAITNVEPSAR
jgi:hypothetical protein